jgi:hypothetical protein
LTCRANQRHKASIPKSADRSRAVEGELHGHAAALVEHGGDDAAVQNARLGVADEDGTVGLARPGFSGSGAVEPKSADVSIDRTARFDGLGKLVKRQGCIQ